MYEIIIFILIALLGILVQSCVGFAGALLSVPLLIIFFSPKFIIPIYSLLTLIINVFLVFESKKHIEWNKIKILSIGGFIGIPIGVYFLANFPYSALKIAVNIIMLVFGVFLFMKINIPLKENKVTQYIVGLLSGFLGGSISTSGPPVVIYGLSIKWKKDAFRATILVYFLIMSAVSNAYYLFLGMFNYNNMKIVLYALVPCLLMSLIGIKIKNNANENIFRKIVVLVVFIVAIIGIVKVFLKG
jgi:uncharacterized membrane protein YfcA